MFLPNQIYKLQPKRFILESNIFSYFVVIFITDFIFKIENKTCTFWVKM